MGNQEQQLKEREADVRPTQKEPIDLSEKGAPVDGTPQRSERRLFMQLQVYGGCRSPQALIEALKTSRLEAVLYQDLHDPEGIGLLSWSEDPGHFVGPVRSLLTSTPFTDLQRKPELTMFGRTYAIGREPDLEEWLLARPRRFVLNPASRWAVWYPLRRKSEFALLPKTEQGKILSEHAMLGRRYGEAGVASDVRLACHGLDTHDNDFVIGLIGKELHPLSRLIQEMRTTQQTGRYLQSLGPFFVGNVLWQSSPSS